MAAKRKKKWIKGALKKHRRGALHRHYGISVRKKIPLKLLVRDQHKRGKLGQRVRFALGRRGYYKKRKKSSRSHRSYNKSRVSSSVRAADRRHREMISEISQEEMVEMLMGKRPMSPKLGTYLCGHLDIDPSMVEHTTKKGYGF